MINNGFYAKSETFGGNGRRTPVTADFIRAADFFQYQGCPGKDVLFGKPGKEMFTVFAGRDVLSQIPVALM